MKILIVDDHSLFREGLKLLLIQLNPKIQTVEASDLPSALSASQQHLDLDLVLFDLGLPGVSGMPALAEFRRLNEGLPVVVLSGTADRDTVMEALECGAMGFVPKTTTAQVLNSALKTVLLGGIHLPSTVLNDGYITTTPCRPASRCLSELMLTARQREVFKLILQGRSNKVIARDLGVTESTIKSHVKPILKALNVTSRVGAIVEVGRLGVLLD
jgi:DNA-binding NarL/FixJ family response regulator